MSIKILKDRQTQIYRTRKSDDGLTLSCDRHSVAGSVSQRACVFCGSRVVLYPVADALHLIHGPIGCAAYTWDIRGAMSSGPELHRMSFSTDLSETDVVYGGEKKLHKALIELIARYEPKSAFVYATCIVGLIGDDVDAVCRRVENETGVTVIPVHSPGFSGTKKTGYGVACEALAKLVGTGSTEGISALSINIMGEFNIAGEAWVLRKYFERMGIEVVSTITGDGRTDDIRRSHGAALNVVQCSGSITQLAKEMERSYGIPFIRVSYFGFEDMADALYQVASHFNDSAMLEATENLVAEEIAAVMPQLEQYKAALTGAKAAIYTGGAFKAFSLVRSLRTLGVRTVIVGSQTGSPEDYALLKELCDDGTILIDDTNPLELSKFIQETGAQLLIGGVKERPVAYKLGIGFCDHNHERKVCLAGFEGMFNFARDVYSSVCSPVWKFIREPGGGTQ